MNSSELGHLRRRECWIFDLDNTLYPAECDLFSQMHVRMQSFVETTLGLDEAGAQEKRQYLSNKYGTTLRGLMCEHDLEPHAYLDFVHDIDLAPVVQNDRLNEALSALPGRKIIFTNATVPHAERVLEKLGVEGHFEVIFDIVASSYRPKPELLPYEELIARHRIQPRESVMVEDMVKNLAPAAAMGMTTVLVPNWVGHDARGEDYDHVHHEVEDLTKWLETVVEG
jgi:putative hydrolase of the HAD superfamily